MNILTIKRYESQFSLLILTVKLLPHAQVHDIARNEHSIVYANGNAFYTDVP